MMQSKDMQEKGNLQEEKETPASQIMMRYPKLGYRSMLQGRAKMYEIRHPPEAEFYSNMFNRYVRMSVVSRYFVRCGLASGDKLPANIVRT